MRKAIETLKNIWKIEDLRQRILITILFVAIYRFGSYVVLPGINPAMLTQLHQQTSEGLLALLNMFSGGDRKSTRLNSSHPNPSRMPSSA